MTTQAIALAALFITVLASLALGARRRSEPLSLRSFYLGNSTLDSSQSAHLFLSTSFSLNGVLYQTFLGYQIGIAALWLQAAWCLSYFVLSRRLRSKPDLFKDHTLHGTLGKLYSTRALRWAAIASIAGFTLQVGWELAVGVKLFNSTVNSGVNLTWLLTIALALVGAIYTILGGLRGNLRANEAQNVIACVALIALTVGVWVSGPYTALPLGKYIVDSHKLLLTLGIGGLISNILFSLVWQLVDMSAWQNLAATQKKSETRTQALSWSAFWVFLFPGLIGTLLGMFLQRRGIPLTDETVVSYAVGLFQHYSVFFFCVFVGFFCALLSTIDGLLLAAAQSLTWDITDREEVGKILELDSPSASETELLRTGPSAPSNKEQEILLKGRVATLVFALCGGTLVAYLLHLGIGLFNIVYAVTVAQMSLVPVVVCMLWSKSMNLSQKRAATSIATGLIGGALWVGLSLSINVKVLGSGLGDYAPIATIFFASLPFLISTGRSK